MAIYYCLWLTDGLPTKERPNTSRVRRKLVVIHRLVSFSMKRTRVVAVFCAIVIGSMLTIQLYFDRAGVGRFVSEKEDIITTSPSAPCGKTCSYDWDSQDSGTFYPLLHKTVNCTNTLHRMAYCPYEVVRPPPRRPPSHLVSNYTINGRCPIRKLWYLDDSSANNKYNISSAQMRRLLDKDRRRNINSYHDNSAVKRTLVKYKHLIEGRRVAVIGTIKPWAEAMLLNQGASHVTTVEYSELIIDDRRISTITPYRLAKQFLAGQTEPFDAVVTFSSLEHSGLGRYGDPLSPYGDLEATAQVWCMVKPGGHFFIGVPVSSNRRSCYIVWNAHRVYGKDRLQHLTANWHVIDQVNAASHNFYVLQKAEVNRN